MVLPVFTQAAGVTVPPSCDAGFYDVMSSRAWMEGEREIEVAQKLILRPDSVLEYSCFSNHLDRLEDNASFAPVNALGPLVRDPLFAHLDGQNYGPYLAGGTFTGTVGICDTMYKVWDFLKCQNFDRDNFMSFEELAAADPRTLPEACSAPGRAQKWNAALTAVDITPANPAPSGGMLAVPSYSNFLDSANCSDIKPIPTGIMRVQSYTERVRRRQGARMIATTVRRTKNYIESVCPAPGCYFDPGGLSDPSCK